MAMGHTSGCDKIRLLLLRPEATTWKYNRDVDIIVSGLTEETDYPYIYCFAEAQIECNVPASFEALPGSERTTN